MTMIGAPIIKDGALDADVIDIITVPGNVDPYAYVISANVHRRHLNAEQKRTAIETLLKAKPEQSNRQIAQQVSRQARADDATSTLEAAVRVLDEIAGDNNDHGAAQELSAELQNAIDITSGCSFPGMYG